jgi:hypothetical protein
MLVMTPFSQQESRTRFGKRGQIFHDSLLPSGHPEKQRHEKK